MGIIIYEIIYNLTEMCQSPTGRYSWRLYCLNGSANCMIVVNCAPIESRHLNEKKMYTSRVPDMNEKNCNRVRA